MGHPVAVEKIKIDAEIEGLLFPLREEELRALRESVLAEGIRDPLVVWWDGEGFVLLDGHHRFRLAQELGLRFDVREVHLRDRAEAKEWVDRNQLGRRNLTDEQRAVVIGRLYEAKKLVQGRPSAEEKKGKMPFFLGANATAKEIASQYRVDEKTVRRHAQFARRVEQLRAISPSAAERVLSGDVVDALTALPKVDDDDLPEIAKRIESGARSIKRSKSEIDRARKTPQIAEIRVTPGLRRGDFREVLSDIPENSVRLILTDPPYPKEYLSLWSDLAKFAAKVLRDDGILVAYSGQMYIHQILSALSEHLDYWWLGAVVHRGNANLTPLGQPVRKVINCWKPLVMFVKRGCGFDGPFRDLVWGAGSEKEAHNWQQPVGEAVEIIERFTQEGDLVVDPFAGSNTVGIAAEFLGRRFIGAEVGQSGTEQMGS